jgi:hypothetical protein
MKNNIISAIIIAIAILGVAILQQRASSGIINQFMSQLENAAVKKDANGKTQITKILEGVSKSATEGMSGGFSAAVTDKKMKDLEAADKIVIKEIKIVTGGNKNKEKVIGIIKNEGTYIVSDINFSAIYRKADDSLLDVSTQFNRVSGTMKPGDELGFELQRELGDYNEKPEVLALNKASKVTLKVVSINIVK